MRLICVGDKMPPWVNSGFNDYAQRLSHAYDFKLHEIALLKRSKNNIKQAIRKETQAILNLLSPSDHVVSLEVLGKQYTTPQLAQRLDAWQQLSKPISFIIGGPEGLAEEVQVRAQEHWSLSPLTLPHPLARIVMIEQIYRAWSILHHHPYHRQ